MQIFNIWHEREKRRGRILHFLDIDFWKVELLIENYVISIIGNQLMQGNVGAFTKR